MNFFRYLDQVIFGTEDACFSSSHKAKDAVERLSTVILHPSPKSKFSHVTSRFTGRQSTTGPDLIGKVSNEKVVIFRYRRGMGRTQFRPIFTGKFAIEDDQTFLKGSFSMALSTKLITVLWLGFSIYFTIMSINASQQEFQPVIFLLPVISLVILLLFYGFGRWASQDDKQFISEKIQSSLT